MIQRETCEYHSRKSLKCPAESDQHTLVVHESDGLNDWLLLQADGLNDWLLLLACIIHHYLGVRMFPVLQNMMEEGCPAARLHHYQRSYKVKIHC